ncbi:srg family chemoreceptor domain-containing protein [Ditylenchus destructor]|nr:srg family chemoreceptor domain-containing protein [Ditylenchus destructor]
MAATLSQWSYPPFIFSLIIGVPSMVLYTLEIGVLIFRNRNFSSAFFRLFIARFIYNFLNYFCSFIFARFGRVGLFLDLSESLPRWVLGVSFFFTYYSFHVDNISTFFILFNRLSLILFPIDHMKFWNYFLPIALLITFLLPLPFTYETVGYDFYVRRQNDNWTYTLDFHKEQGKTYVRSVYLCAVSAIFFCGICGMLNFLAIFFYRRNNLALAAKVSCREDHKVESRLTVYAFVTFMTQFGISMYMILLYLFSGSLERDDLFLTTFNQYGWVNDVCTIAIPAWTLLWASSKVREAILEILLRNRRWPLPGREVNVKFQQNSQNSYTITLNDNFYGAPKT